VKPSPALSAALTVGIPADSIESKVTAPEQSGGSRGQSRWFFVGKVPMSVIRKRFGGSARQEVMGEMIQSLLLYEARCGRKSLTRPVCPALSQQ